MARLNYTSELKGFEYTSGEYALKAVKNCMVIGTLSSVDDGIVRKNDEYIGNFFVHIEGDKFKISINNMEAEEMVLVIPVINEMLTAIAE